MTAVGPRQPRASCHSYASVDISTEADGLSDVINLGGLTLSSIQISTAWTTARLAFLGSVDNTTNFAEVKTPAAAAAASILVYHSAAGHLYAIDPNLWHGIHTLQLVSVATGSTTAVAQAAVRTIKLGLSEITKRS